MKKYFSVIILSILLASSLRASEGDFFVKLPTSVSGEIANNWLDTKNTVRLWNAYVCTSEEGITINHYREEIQHCFNEIKKYPLDNMLSIPEDADDNELKTILSKFQNVRNLYCGSPAGITGFSMKFICSLSNLRGLCVSRCMGFDDAALSQMYKLTFLEEVSLRNCYWLTNEGLSHLSVLENLTILNLSGCYKLTDGGLSSIIKINSLTTLNLYGCKKLTDEGISMLSSMERLVDINISNCGLFTDMGFSKFSLIRNIKSLSLGSSQHLTDTCLSRTLSVLDISYCAGFTYDGIQQYLSLFKSITNVDITGWNQLANGELSNLRLSNPNVKIDGTEVPYYN